MSLLMKWNHLPTAYKWFLLALLLSILCLLFTLIYATGAFNLPALEVERWLLVRPLTRLDCVFYEWRNFGEVLWSLLFTAILGVFCIRAGYRRRVLPYLLLLLLLGVGTEVIGKDAFGLPLPTRLRSGMTNLTCPQMHDKPEPIRIATTLGLWWEIPPPTTTQKGWIRDVARMPFDFHGSSRERGYPSGHALRWSFIGLVASWLAWHHLLRRPIRILLTAIAFILAFAGGFLQFYIGVHTITDTIAGYLLGAALACAAIGLLMLNATKQRAEPTLTPLSVATP